MTFQKKKIILIVSALAAAAACTAAILFFVKKPEPAVEEVIETTEPETTDEPTETQYVATEFGKVNDLTGLAKTLLSQNQDTVGWIYIEGTKVDGPVVQSDDNAYYLDIGFDHKPNRAGAMFMDYRNVFGFDVSKQSDNIVIYGHNMANNTMFGSLRKYRQDLSYYETHRFIELSSNYDNYTYVIFGLVITSGSASADWRYWDMEEFANEQEFNDFVSTVRQKNMTDINVDVKYGDQLLTLSTCYSDADDSRFLVIARKMREGESAEDFLSVSEPDEEVQSSEES